MAGFCCGKIHHAAILSPAQPFLVGGLIDRADRLPDRVKERGAGNLVVYYAYSCLCFAATLTLILGLMCTDTEASMGDGSLMEEWKRVQRPG